MKNSMRLLSCVCWVIAAAALAEGLRKGIPVIGMVTTGGLVWLACMFWRESKMNNF